MAEVDVTSMRSWEFYELHFARTRLQHYLARTGGDEVAAMELYRWNAAISGAFWQSLAYFEVAFRNALDVRMSERHALLGRSGSGTRWSPGVRCFSGRMSLVRLPMRPRVIRR